MKKQKNLTETDDFLSIWRYFCWPGNMTQGEIAKKVLCDSSRSWIAMESHELSMVTFMEYTD